MAIYVSTPIEYITNTTSNNDKNLHIPGICRFLS